MTYVKIVIEHEGSTLSVLWNDDTQCFVMDISSHFFNIPADQWDAFINKLQTIKSLLSDGKVL